MLLATGSTYLETAKIMSNPSETQRGGSHRSQGYPCVHSSYLPCNTLLPCLVLSPLSFLPSVLSTSRVHPILAAMLLPPIHPSSFPVTNWSYDWSPQLWPILTPEAPCHPKYMRSPQFFWRPMIEYSQEPTVCSCLVTPWIEVLFQNISYGQMAAAAVLRVHTVFLCAKITLQKLMCSLSLHDVKCRSFRERKRMWQKACRGKNDTG